MPSNLNPSHPSSPMTWSDPAGLVETVRPAEWWLSRGVARALYGALDQHDPSGNALEREVAALVAEHGDLVYAELIFLLTRLRVDPSEARTQWPLVVGRQRDMEVRLGHPVDIRAALLNYFVDVDRRLDRPKLVEMEWADWTAASALIDDVTGLPNQRYFRQQLARDVERSHRENAPLSLILIDADDFKSVNDHHGHEVGTATLREMGRRLRRQARDEDLVARYGGDEFAVLCPSTPKAEAGRVAETLRGAVAACVLATAGTPLPVRLTVSAGVATCPGDAADGDALFALADRAAYQAKDAGKNRVELYGGSTRSFRRRRLVWPGRLVPGSAPALPIQTTEIGEGGCAFRSDHALEVGALAETILTPPQGPDLRLAARVAWCRAVPPHAWDVAVRFVEQGRDRDRLVRWVRTAADSR